MGGVFSRRVFLGGLASSVGSVAFAETPTVSLRPTARPPKPLSTRDLADIPGSDEIIRKAALNGKVSFAVADLKTGRILESRSGARALPPASVAKALTALYALDTLGASFRFSTQLLTRGPLENGILSGDLVLAGGGDPTLQTNDLAAMAKSLKESGLRELRGKFLIWEGALPYQHQIDSGQPSHVGYNPSVSGLNLNFNRVYFEWKPAAGDYSVTLDARSDRYRPNVRSTRMRIVDQSFPVYTYTEKPGVDHWTVARKALGKGGGRWLPTRQPAHYAAEVFDTFARSHGIKLPAPEIAKVKPSGQVIAQHLSQPLSVIVTDMLKYSTNITAEVLGLTATQRLDVNASTLRDSAQAMSRWAEEKYGITGFSLIDHSGLGDGSRLTPYALLQTLVSVRQSSVLYDVLKTIPMRNAEGGPNPDHHIKVKAKTGTLNFVSSLAGYAISDLGTEHAFVILSADLERRAAIPKEERERPKGARGWSRRSRRMQQQLIERWGAVYRGV
jgi:D-alanyl-D-alanine carboxypeptidase/D-alanyl-D-alanine-endopeptidase (penicillin-binding protein 4)